jgi:chromosome segregation ATPase
MIVTNIDGSIGGGTQILDLLSLVAADPKVYQSKLKELQDAADRHQKYVEAVGPVSDIIILRKQAKIDTESAAQELKEASVKAETIVKEAQAKADEIIAQAQADLVAAKNEAAEVTSKASILMSQAQQAQTAVDQAEKEAKTATATAQTKSKQLDVAIVTAQAAEEAAEAVKAGIVAKHKAFLESL